MIVGACGFSWSGSSAVSDLLSEYSENQVYNKIEFILAFFPDGLDDLYYQLNTHNAKFLSSTIAIPRYKRVAKALLSKPTGGKIVKLTDNYIDELTQVKWSGSGQGEEVLHSNLYNTIADYGFKVIRKMPWLYAVLRGHFPFSEKRMSINVEKFESITQDYIDEILKTIGLDLTKNIVLDQPFPGNNPLPSMRFFRDSKAIVVDRDPRDLYVLCKKYYPTRALSVPHDRVKDFINYYKLLHSAPSLDSKHVMNVRFEDLIYQYDLTVKAIESFLGLKSHDRPQSRFIPRESMVNTQLFRRAPEYIKDIEVIEEELTDFLFNFSKFQFNPTKNEVFDEKRSIPI